MISSRKTPSTTSAAPGEDTSTTGAAPGGRTCPKCQAAVPAAGSWCPGCGLQVSDPCWECGHPLPEGANFCGVCGTPNTEPAVVQCPGCKAVVGRGFGYCTACGAQARPVCQECDRPMRREWAHCPHCGDVPVGAGASPVVEEYQEPTAPAPWIEAPPARSRDGEQLNAAGIRAYEAEDYHEAARLFRQAISAEPDNARYHTNLGVACGELEDDTAAFAAYQRAIELDPTEVLAFLNLGYLYNERERQAEAREMWERVIRLAPDSEEAEEARQNLQNLEEI